MCLRLILTSNVFLIPTSRGFEAVSTSSRSERVKDASIPSNRGQTEVPVSSYFFITFLLNPSLLERDNKSERWSFFLCFYVLTPHLVCPCVVAGVTNRNQHECTYSNLEYKHLTKIGVCSSRESNPGSLAGQVCRGLWALPTPNEEKIVAGKFVSDNINDWIKKRLLTKTY